MEWIVLPVFYLLYWGMCYLFAGSDKKNLASLRSYPKEVQIAVKENEMLKEFLRKEKSPLAIMASNFILFNVIFILLGILVNKVFGITEFPHLFVYFLAFGEGLNLFDLLVVDLLWWRNSKRIRFSFLMAKEPYQNPKEHLLSFLRGIPVFAFSALLSAFVSSLF